MPNQDVLKFCEIAYNYDILREKQPTKIHKYHEMVLDTLLHGEFKGEQQTIDTFFVNDGSYKDKRLADCYIRVETGNWWGYRLNINNGIVQYYIDQILTQEKSRQIVKNQQDYLWEQITHELPTVFIYNGNIYWVNFQTVYDRANNAPIRIIGYNGAIKDVWHQEIALNDMIAMTNGNTEPFALSSIGDNRWNVAFHGLIYTFMHTPNKPYVKYTLVGVAYINPTIDTLDLDRRNISNTLITQLHQIIAQLNKG